MNRDQTIAKLVQASAMLAAIGEERSFTNAAGRLNVDQSAVSHRTKALEDFLGHTLFDRTTRRLRLTETGEILCQAALDTMVSWEIALDKLERSQTTNMIRLSLPSSLAMKWLIPALPNAAAVGLSVSVDVNEVAVDFLSKEADAAIRFGHGPYPGLHSTHLSHCWLQPVASPGYIANRPDSDEVLGNPEVTLLADCRGETDKTDFSWDYYISKSKTTLSSVSANHHFDRADLMLQAAVGGMGIGLGRTLLIEGDIKIGHLQTVDTPVRMESGYWLVCTPAFAETNRFKRLRDWLKDEVAATKASAAR